VTAALPDPQADPGAYVTAVVNLRERRIKSGTPGPYEALSLHTINGVDWQIHAGPAGAVWLYVGNGKQDRADAEHIAAEANPAHALAEVALWRRVAERHGGVRIEGKPYCGTCRSAVSPCADLLAVVAACRAYAGDAS
jgi:hypothetical protein